MKAAILFCFLFCGCATAQMRQEPTVFMNSAAKIQYYQEQINRYNALIEQEKKKATDEQIKR